MIYRYFKADTIIYLNYRTALLFNSLILVNFVETITWRFLFILKKPTVHSMNDKSYPGLSFFLLDSSQGGLLGNTDPAAEFPLEKKNNLVTYQ